MMRSPGKAVTGFCVIILTTPIASAQSAKIDVDMSKALAAFVEALNESALTTEPELADCKLSGGTETTCLKFTVEPSPQHAPGPWCPRNIADGPEKSGIWIDSGEVYDADGLFIENLATFYDDPNWQLFDPATGNIRVTDTPEGCLAAARPDVDPDYNNYCVQCQTADVVNATDVTYFIPLRPVMADKASPLVDNPGAGVAFNGVRFEGPAPVDAILGAHTLAPFDDCGGHVNPFAGYHYHAVTGCTEEVGESDAHAAMIGIAIDGFGMHTRFNADDSEPQGLDACRGHSDDKRGYHYHVSDPGTNRIIGCLSGELGCAMPSEDGTCDATQRRRPPPR